MNKLLYKEFRLCLVLQIPLFFLFSLMQLIPNYPYLVGGFFVCNGIFFSFVQAQADNDLLFTALLPVSKADTVRGKLRFVELIQLVSLPAFVLAGLLSRLLGGTQNAAGVDVSLTLLGGLLALYAIFNAVFVPRYFRAAEKVGKHFLVALIAVFAWIVVFEGFMIVAGAAGEQVPLFGWVETHLDCFPATAEALLTQAIFLAICALAYLGLELRTKRRTIRIFEQVDL